MRRNRPDQNATTAKRSTFPRTATRIAAREACARRNFDDVGLRLRKVDREVFALRFHEGLKQREIAERLGVSQMQVSRILRRITDQLRDTIELESRREAGQQPPAA